MININNINDILNNLNEEIDNYSAGVFHIKSNFKMMSRFTYETSGYYCWIKFGNEILWDSENEPRKWVEEKDDYEDLQTFIKKEFNKYVNTLKRFRFSDVENGDKVSEAYDAADKGIEVISEIKTLKREWDTLHNNLQDDVYEKIVSEIEKYN